MKKSEKLIKRLEDEFNLKAVSFYRCYPGYWQRKAGTWVWWVELDNGRLIGSSQSVTSLLKCKKWYIVVSPVLSVDDEIVGE